MGQLEQTNVKLVQYCNHLKFNLNCKTEKVIQASLNIDCSIKSQRVGNRINRAQRGLSKKRIGLCTHKIKKLKEDIVMKESDLSKSLPSDLYNKVAID